MRRSKNQIYRHVHRSKVPRHTHAQTHISVQSSYFVHRGNDIKSTTATMRVSYTCMHASRGMHSHQINRGTHTDRHACRDADGTAQVLQEIALVMHGTERSYASIQASRMHTHARDRRALVPKPIQYNCVGTQTNHTRIHAKHTQAIRT